MSEFKPIRIGDRVTQFPALTHNALIAGEQERRNQPLAIDDPRRPKQKLSVLCRIVWDGADTIGPGSVVKLGNVVHEPATDTWAPFDGLIFHGSAFGAGDTGEPYAIIQGPASQNEVVDAVIAQSYWAKVNISDATHEYVNRPASGNTLISATAGDRILWKETGTGEKWAVVSLSQPAMTCIRGIAQAASPPSQKHVIISIPKVLGTNVALPDSIIAWKGARTAGTVGYMLADNSWWNIEEDEYVLAAHMPGYHDDTAGSTGRIIDWVWIPNQRGFLWAKATTDISAATSETAPGAGSGTLYYWPHTSASVDAAAPVSLGSIGLINPHKYSLKSGGLFAVEYMAEWLGSPYYFGILGDDLISLPGHGVDKMLVTDGATGYPEWSDIVPAWVFTYPSDPIPTAGSVTSVSAGYAIDISGTASEPVVDFDPTEITSFAAAFQIFRHLSTDTNPSGANSPHWKTISNFDSAKNQIIVNEPTDSWSFRDAYTVKSTIDDTTAAFLHDAIKDNATYVSGQDAIVANDTDGAGGTNQKERLFVDVSAISGWSSGTIQLLGHDATGALKWDSVANWLNTLSGYNSAVDQSIGHDASAGATEWQDDGDCTA